MDITPNMIWHETAIVDVQTMAKGRWKDAQAYRMAATNENQDTARRWIKCAEEQEQISKSLAAMADMAARQRCLISTRWIIRAGEKGDVTQEDLENYIAAIEIGETLLDEDRKLDDTTMTVRVIQFVDPADGKDCWSVVYLGAKRSVTIHASMFDARIRADELLLALEALG